MNARRAARELVLIILSQSNIDKYVKKDVEDITLSLVRTLSNNAEDELKTIVNSLVDTKHFIETYEAENPVNLKRPLEVQNLPVHLPMTSDMTGKLDSLINVVEKCFQALEVAELSALADKKDVKIFIDKILSEYFEHKEEVDNLINESSIGWNIDRFVKIDRDILRIAATELLYLENIPTKVSVDEAVELAKKYSNEESYSFINGILGKIIKINNIKK